jgi:nitroreductase
MKENDLLRVIRERRSVLRFEERPVPEDAIQSILEAGRWAPSYINSQPWEFIVVRSPRMRARVADAVRRLTISWQGFIQAPVVIIVAVNTETDPRHHLQDGAAAAQNMSLMAQGLGLASLWVGLHAGLDPRSTPEEDLRTLLRVPHTLRLVSAIPVGYPAERDRATTRRPLAEMVHEDVYSAGRRRRRRTPALS